MSIYLSYHDDDLASFASMGLVRRAKKSLDDVTLTSAPDAEPLSFMVEDNTVTLPKTGIQSASCTCGAHECCKHVLSAVLWLQENLPAKHVIDDLFCAPE